MFPSTAIIILSSGIVATNGGHVQREEEIATTMASACQD
jgi:hypothetical protein